LEANLIACTGKRRPDIVSRRDESVVVKDIALTDLPGEHLHVRPEFLLQRSLFIRQGRKRALVTLSRHPDHVASALMALEDW
jgi:hypothetical protein